MNDGSSASASSRKDVEISKRTRRRVAILSFGSRGDTQPLMALALRFRGESHDVWMGGAKDFQDLASSLGIQDYVVTHPPVGDFLRNNAQVREAMATGNYLKFLAATGEFRKKHLAESIRITRDAMLQFQPDVILANTLVGATARCLEQILKVPFVLVNLQNVMPTSQVRSVLGESFGSYFCWCLTWFLGSRANRAASVPIIRTVLKEIPPDEPLYLDHFQTVCVEGHNPIAPALIGCSPTCMKSPTDIGGSFTSRVLYTGPWHITSRNETSKDVSPAVFGDWRRIETFLDSSEDAPIYLGFGSMIAISPKHMVKLAVSVLKDLGERGIILGGFANLSVGLLQDEPNLLEYAASNRVLFVESAPHIHLFPRCKALVIHGGAGTLAAALGAGTPTVIVPMFVDQFANAGMLNETGAGIGLRQFQSVTAADLSGALRKVLQDSRYRVTAERIAEEMKKEDGTGVAVASVETFLSREVDTGLWRRRHEFVLEQRRKPKMHPILFFFCMLLFDMVSPYKRMNRWMTND